MLRKLKIISFPPSTNYNSLVCVHTVRNVDPITFFAHRNLLIAVAMYYDIRFVGSTLNFQIFCLRFGPHIIPRIPHSGVGRTTHKLMPRDIRTYRPLLMVNKIVDTHTLIIESFFQHPQGLFPPKLKLRLRYRLPLTGP